MSTLKWENVSDFRYFQHLRDENGWIKVSIDYEGDMWHIRVWSDNWAKYPEIKSVDEARAMAEVLYRMGG